jgi:PatG Domain
MEPAQNVAERDNEVSTQAVPASTGSPAEVTAQSCPSCAAAAASPAQGQRTPAAGSASLGYIYAIGKIQPRFPKISVEKEFAQAVGRDKASGLTDRQALHAVLSKPGNGYLVRQLCWIMTIEGLETYILVPRDPTDYSLLVEALRPTPQPWDLDCVIGFRGPVAGPEVCNGMMVPIVAFDQIYSFDRDSLVKAIPCPEKAKPSDFAPAAGELFDRIMQMTDNAGSTDRDRALNYLALRYPAIYANAAEAFAHNESLTGVYVVPSPLSGTRKIVDVIFSYTNRTTDVVEKFFTRVDVTDEFPFLLTALSPYYDR